MYLIETYWQIDVDEHLFAKFPTKIGLKWVEDFCHCFSILF
jgi:hypothetical protein